ncbi:hypothetical protein COCNU_11G006970 [Cocos nucifera]|uniref:Uncharacterized protein n=1 Tax=Cocos nucifera TaxID=13894 RepID=A0A8K0IPR7_COCNU|nr:hypothetical protein COCNU_11G006970 [Cocos nucifera]
MHVSQSKFELAILRNCVFWWAVELHLYPVSMKTRSGEKLELQETLVDVQAKASEDCASAPSEAPIPGKDILLNPNVFTEFKLADSLEVGVTIAACKFDLDSSAPFQTLDIPNLQPVVKHSVPVCSETRNLMQAGKAQLAEGLLNEAYTLFSEAFSMLQQIAGPMHQDVADCCGPDHPDVAATFTNVAVTYQDIGNMNIALCYLQEAQKKNEQLLGPEHTQTDVCRHALAIAFNRKCTETKGAGGEYSFCLKGYRYFEGQAQYDSNNMLQQANPDLLQAFQAVAVGSGNTSTSSASKSLNAAITAQPNAQANEPKREASNSSTLNGTFSWHKGCQWVS